MFLCAEFLHVKPGKGSAFVRTKLRNLVTGSTTEKTFRAGEGITIADVAKKDCQYTYNEVWHQGCMLPHGTQGSLLLDTVHLQSAMRYATSATKWCFSLVHHPLLQLFCVLSRPQVIEELHLCSLFACPLLRCPCSHAIARHTCASHLPCAVLGIWSCQGPTLAMAI